MTRAPGAGYSDAERKQQAQHLGLRSIVLFMVFLMVFLVGVPLVLAALGSQPVTDVVPSPVHVTPTWTVPPERLG